MDRRIVPTYYMLLLRYTTVYVCVSKRFEPFMVHMICQISHHLLLLFGQPIQLSSYIIPNVFPLSQLLLNSTISTQHESLSGVID